MAKKNNPPKVEISYLVFSNMVKYVYLNKLSEKQFAEALEVTTRTLKNYMENPGSITMARIQIFIDNMGMDIYTLLAV